MSTEQTQQLETPESATAPAQNGSATTRRSESQTYTIVLVQDQGEGELALWTEVGEMTVPARTQRSTVLERVLAGQGERDLEVPQIPLADGDEGQLLLVSSDALGERTRVRAVNRLEVEPAPVVAT
jgi:hypothetical protein